MGSAAGSPPTAVGSPNELQANEAKALHQELTCRVGWRVSQRTECSIGLSEGEGATHAEAEVALLLLVSGGGWKGGRRGGRGSEEGEQMLQEWKKGKVGMCTRPVPFGGIFGKEADDAATQLLSEGGGRG